MNGQRYIVASLDDYKIARELGVKILGPVLKGATPRCEKLVEVASGFEREFTRTEMEQELQWHRQTVTKYLQEAVSLGCLDEYPQGKGSPVHYRFIKELAEVTCPLLEVDALKERMVEGGDTR